MKKLIGLIVLAAVAVLAPTVRAEDRDTTQAQTGRQVPLKVQLVVARYQGEKKVSSLPYTLSVVANDGDKTSLRMTLDVPIPQTVFSTPKEGGPATTPVASYSYRSVGTNIDCQARTVEEGVFKLDLGVSDSSVFAADKEANPGRVGPPVTIRNFTSTFNVMLRDGQTVQHTSATDPVTGEVLRIDVTLTVLK